MNDFFTVTPGAPAAGRLASSPDVSPDVSRDAGPAETPSEPAGGQRSREPGCAVRPLEINPARRRRDTDLVVEPGDDARAMARLLRQDVTDFVAIAINERIHHLANKLAN